MEFICYLLLFCHSNVAFLFFFWGRFDGRTNEKEERKEAGRDR